MTLSLANGQISTGSAVASAGGIAVFSTSSFAEVEADWRVLEAQGIESPGQSFDFLSTWISAFEVLEENQQFVVARRGDRPIAAMALQRRHVWGMCVLTPFPGGHVGTNAPLIDRDVLAAMTPDERAALWKAMGAAFSGAELAYLCCYPEDMDGLEGVFDGFGLHTRSDELHRAVFSSWEDCDAQQRSRSRRKHDKQQGAKLDAMGAVSFEVLDADDDVDAVLDCMFVQRNARFKQQGISDPFDAQDVRRFYQQVFAQHGALAGRLHVLRLDGEIVAVRYNLIHGDRMFCLISSMSIAAKIQPGSPGKQCLLRVMQSEFDNGYTMFDMGSGLTDEKRHWCNVHIPLRHHYVPISLRGHVFVQAHRVWQRLKLYLKRDERVFGLLKSWRVKVFGKR